MATKKKSAKSTKGTTNGTSKSAIVQKLLKKGLSQKQANAFATQAAKRSAAKKKG